MVKKICWNSIKNMNWFKKIFQKNSPDTDLNKTIKSTNETPLISINTLTKTKYVGIDREFVNLLYFKNEEEKEKFIDRIEKVIIKLKINNDTDIVTAINKLVEYELNLESKHTSCGDDESDFILFIRKFLLFNEFTVISTKTNNNTKVIEELKGITKITKWTPLDICFYNLEKKTENNFLDFQWEETLISDAIKNNHLINYERIDALYRLGYAFYKANNIEKMEHYFNIIRSEKYNLGPTTIVNYYRSIDEIYGKIYEIYNELKQDGKALEWLKFEETFISWRFRANCAGNSAAKCSTLSALNCTVYSAANCAA
ncbi:MAG: hypothetical protein WC974_09540 [Thermoplasmata archaeon]